MQERLLSRQAAEGRRGGGAGTPPAGVPTIGAPVVNAPGGRPCDLGARPNGMRSGVSRCINAGCVSGWE
ncbi:MAG: hypothetical protein KatS3mg058_3970 [Roseiflexus sp.]|nr:MAG: hypothetical protein KatS3mg058_3970 [Roseiflexus sp.]